MDLIKLFSGGFPLTIERLTFLQQTYNKALTQLTSFYGLNDNEIGVIKGLSVTTGTVNTISDGIVIYNGEVMEFRGNAYDTGNFIIAEETTQIPYNEDVNNDGDLDLKDSDVVRFMTTEDSGLTGEFVTLNYPLNYLPTLQQIMPKIGEVKMWKGTAANVPSGWAIIQDMEGRFPVGMSSSGSARNVNQNGGSNTKTIQKANIPSYTLSGTTFSGGGHNHDYVDGYFIEKTPAGQGRQDQFEGYGSEEVGTGFSGSGDTDNDNKYIYTKDRTTDYQSSHTHGISLSSGGSGTAMDITPSNKALFFIEFIGY